MATFLTGATGFLGRYLARKLLDQGEDLVLLVRGDSAAVARSRARKAIDGVGDAPSERFDPAVTVSLGDLDRPGLGLSPGDRERVVERCERFLHCGASVRFDLPIDRARAVNVEGTRSVLDLARARQRSAGGLGRVDYVGTAYVAGNRTDVVLEEDLDAHLGFKNTYEQTKFEAEQVVRAAMAELPIAIHRPSIVVGEAATGRTSSFNKMIYWPARTYASGLWRICPGDPNASIDIVPVDFVRDALLAIRESRESIGRCFHLAAGLDGSLVLGDFARILSDVFPGRKPVRFVNPGWWMRYVHPVIKRLAFGATRRVIQSGEMYVPYFSHNPRFDNRGAAAMLARAGVSVPRVEDYVHGLFRYCVETNWGAREPSGGRSAE